MDDVANYVLGDAVREAKTLGLSRARAAEIFSEQLDRWFPAGDDQQ
jgi:hypothetical protein